MEVPNKSKARQMVSEKLQANQMVLHMPKFIQHYYHKPMALRSYMQFWPSVWTFKTLHGFKCRCVCTHVNPLVICDYKRKHGKQSMLTSPIHRKRAFQSYQPTNYTDSIHSIICVECLPSLSNCMQSGSSLLKASIFLRSSSRDFK